jgi:hypothetical protein
MLSQPRIKVLKAINACYTSLEEWIVRRMHRYGATSDCDISSSVRLLAEFFYFRQSVLSLCSVHQIPVSHTPGVGSNDDLFTVSIHSSWDEYINLWFVSIDLITGILKCLNRNLAFLSRDRARYTYIQRAVRVTFNGRVNARSSTALCCRYILPGQPSTFYRSPTHIGEHICRYFRGSLMLIQFH